MQRFNNILNGNIFLLLTLIVTYIFVLNCYGTNLVKIKEYLDLNFSTLLESHSVYGGVGCVVLGDDYITFAGGYTDKSHTTMMNPITTTVPVASISKLFTTLAILQLIEQGKVDFDANINLYLRDFSIYFPFGKPITIHNLLTHTAGFDDKFLCMGAPTKEQILPLGRYLSIHLPEIVYPPGYTISYSNHGFAILGHVIETTSKLSFNEYIRKNILEPLEMVNSNFDNLIPAGTTLPKGYYHILNNEKEAYQDFAQTPPASSLITSAEDFSHFLIMLINEGKFHNKQILKPETVKEMFVPRYKFNPVLPGYACAWEENYIAGKRIFQHSGLTWGFSSLCILIPEEKFGLFISINSDKNALLWELSTNLINKFTIPKKSLRKIRSNPSKVPSELYEQLTGFYRFNRYCRNDIFRLATLFPSVSHEIYIKGNFEEKRIYIYPLEFGAKSWCLEEIGDLLWGRISINRISNSTPIMTISPALTPTHWQVIFGNNAYEAIPFYDSKPFKYALLGGGIAIFLLNTMRILIKLLLGIFTRDYLKNLSGTEFLSLAFLIYIILFLFYLFEILEPQTLGYGIPIGLFILIALSFVLMVMTILTSINYLMSGLPLSIKNLIPLLTILACYAILYLMYNANILDLRLSFLKSLNLGNF